MTAALTYRLRLAVAIGLALSTLGMALLLAIPLSFPTGSFRGPIPLAAVSEAKAEAALRASPPRIEEAWRETRATLRQRPMDATAWARMAWLSDQAGRNAEMLDAFGRTYAVAPFGPNITEWRLQFAFDRWSQLTPDLRREVLAELGQVRRDRPGLVERVRPALSDPAGRLAFAISAPKPG